MIRQAEIDHEKRDQSVGRSELDLLGQGSFGLSQEIIHPDRQVQQHS